jgi:bile acid:Na+ symporter, BASS family
VFKFFWEGRKMNTLRKLSDFAGKYMAILSLAVAVAALFIPHAFTWAAPHITMLLGIVMFGMGLTLKLSDFREVFRRPKDVFAGFVFQFTVMPVVAFLLAKIFRLPPELAVGVILVGTCPGGTSSNVMTYLAKGDVALSVSMTMVSTVAAPLMTPFLTWWLAGTWVQVSFWAMFWSICKVVLLPIVLGLIVHQIFGDKVTAFNDILPLISVTAIALIIGAVVGGNASKLMTSGLLVCLVVVLHNMCGYALGFFGAKLFGMNEAKRNAVAIEVGMQNSGLAVTLAAAHFAPAAAIPGAIFSVWHNFSGSIVANFMANRARKNTARDSVQTNVQPE